MSTEHHVNYISSDLPHIGIELYYYKPHKPLDSLYITVTSKDIIIHNTFLSGKCYHWIPKSNASRTIKIDIGEKRFNIFPSDIIGVIVSKTHALLLWLNYKEGQICHISPLTDVTKRVIDDWKNLGWHVLNVDYDNRIIFDETPDPKNRELYLHERCKKKLGIHLESARYEGYLDKDQ